MASYGSYRSLYGPANATNITAAPVAITQNDGTSKRFGGHFVIDVTAGSTLSLTPTIDAFDTVSGKWYNILTGTAITATGTTVLRIYPGVTAQANAAASDVLPPIWRLVMTHGNANPATYTVTARLFD